jgi:surface antigen
VQVRDLLFTLLAASLSAHASHALAQNLLFLNDAPIQAMTPADLDLLKQSMYRALDETHDGDSLNWENPSTGARGTITPTASWQDQGQPCRTLQFDNRAKGRSGRSSFSFCKQNGGPWMIVSQ